MASDSSYFPSRISARETLLTYYAAARNLGRLPGFDWSTRFAHWAIRLPLIALLATYGLQKFPDALIAPGSYGVPALLFILAAFGEVLGAVAIAVGGVIETLRPKQRVVRLVGDVLTRGGGFAGASAVIGVIAFFYWGVITLDSIHVMALGLSLYFLLRGNGQFGKRARVTA